MMLAAGPLLWIFNKVTPYYYFYPDREGSPVFSFWYCLWYCCGAMLYQGTLHWSKSASVEAASICKASILISFRPLPSIPERRTKRNAQSSERSSGRRRLLALRYRDPDGLFGQSGRLSDFPELQQSHQHAARFARQQELAQLGNFERIGHRRLSQGSCASFPLSVTFDLYAPVAPCQTSEDPKYRSLYEGSIFADQSDDTLLEKIRDHNHYYIEWKTNLLFLMKSDYLKTNTCDFSLGEHLMVTTNARWQA
jgi:hypothetical protein